jgi:hypothetical protein
MVTPRWRLGDESNDRILPVARRVRGWCPAAAARERDVAGREGEPQVHPRVLELVLLRLLRVGTHDLELRVGSEAVLVGHDHLHLEQPIPTGLQL